MSLVNVIHDPARDCVHLVTDGAALDADGRLAAVMHKATVLPSFNLAFGFRGTVDLAFSVGFLASRCPASTYGRRFEAMFVGHDGQQPDAFLVCNSGHCEPWTALDLPHGVIGPPVDEALLRAFWTNDPLADLPAILAAQRRQPSALFPLPYVGAFAEVVTVGRRSITRQVLGTWPDKIGEVIDPKAPLDVWQAEPSRADPVAGRATPAYS